MNEEEIVNFVNNYQSESDYYKICLEIYGNYPESWYDLNVEFRNQVLQKIKELHYEIPLELLKDLYIAVAEQSAKVWGCYRYFYEIGQALIEKSRTKYVLEYLYYSGYTFDTSLNSEQAKWENDVILEIRAFLEQQKKIQTDEQILKNIDFGLKRRFRLRNS